MDITRILKTGFINAIVIAFFTGCASTSTNNFIAEMSKVDKAYGIVDDIFDSDHKVFNQICNLSEIRELSKPYCADKGSYKAVVLTVALVPRKVFSTIFVPANLGIKNGTIIEYKPNNVGGFKRVAALQETEACRWTGFTRSNAGGAAIGFAAGAFIVPGVVLMTSGMDEGGVECEGWSYKTLRNKENV